MKALQKLSKWLSDYTSIVVIAIAVVTFIVPGMMGWVNHQLFTDPVSNKFTSQSIIIGIIMFSMGLTLTTQDFKILAQRPFDICVGALAQYLIMPFLAFALTKVLHLPAGIALGLILVGCCPGGVSSNIMSYLCGGDVAFSVGMTTVSTILSPIMTPLMVSLLASGTNISIKALPMKLACRMRDWQQTLPQRPHSFPQHRSLRSYAQFLAPGILFPEHCLPACLQLMINTNRKMHKFFY